MKVFLLDLWLDLREKRLAPVAIALLAGIVALPFVLARGDAEVPPPPPASTATPAAAPVIASDATEDALDDSRLQTFSPRDPFEPTEVVAPTTPAGTADGTATPDSGGAGGTDGGAAPTGGGDVGGGATGGEPTTGGSGTGSGTGTTTNETRTRVFTYTVDLRFGEAGDMKAFRDVKRLELIPNEDNPKVVFLGVTTTARTAVFLVDSNVGVETDEGRCRPSADECTFLYLRADEDHDQARLTDDDGTVFNLRLLDIDRVAVSSSDGGSDNSDSGGNTRSDRSPAFTGRARDSEETVPGDTPPGEPRNRSAFQQFFADSSAQD